MNWQNASPVVQKSYICGHCNNQVAPSLGYSAVEPQQRNGVVGEIFICPNCTKPTFFYFYPNNQIPKAKFGKDVGGISKIDIANLYQEARDCTSVGAYTATVMICRKILMNLAVQQGAKENQSFANYVDYLADKGFIPPQGKQWVDSIRKRGNEANHEIALMEEKDAKMIIHFTEMLLRFNYELPSVLEADNK